AQPGGALKTTRDGIVYQGPDRAPVPRKSTTQKPEGAVDAPLPSFPAPSKTSPGPLGAPVVDAAFVTRRGRVAKYEKGISITIVEKSGRERLLPLAKTAKVYEGLKVGDEVLAQVPFDESSDGKTADLVEKQKPPPTPMLQPGSAFSQAQSGR